MLYNKRFVNIILMLCICCEEIEYSARRRSYASCYLRAQRLLRLWLVASDTRGHVIHSYIMNQTWLASSKSNSQSRKVLTKLLFLRNAAIVFISSRVCVWEARPYWHGWYVITLSRNWGLRHKHCVQFYRSSRLLLYVSIVILFYIYF